MKSILISLLLFVSLPFMNGALLNGQGQDQIRKLRVAYHIFNDDGGMGNFQADSIEHSRFLSELTQWINHKMLNLDTLKPAVSSEFVKSTNTQIILDTIFYHQDSYAWDCSDSLDSEYMRLVHVDENEDLSYLQKHQTLPIFFGDNYHVVGGHVSRIGSKRHIAMRGVYTMFKNIGFDKTIYECGRNIFHELGHAMGLDHNFQGGVNGDQCDQCDDNGCPQEGTSNNLMDYWPSYGGGISYCQLGIINQHLSGELGSIGDVLVNDSCYTIDQAEMWLISDYQKIEDTIYARESWKIEEGGRLEISGTVSFSHGEKILLDPGAELILEGAVLTNMCGDLWGGIEVTGNPDEPIASIKIFSNTQIEHALAGVMVSGDAQVSIQNSSFFNCVTSIAINDCAVDGNFGLGNGFYSDARYHHSEEGIGLLSFIELNRSDFDVLNSFFLNTDQYRSEMPDQTGVGIRVSDSELSSVGNVFQFLSIGISAIRDSLDTKLEISNNQFDYCLSSVLNKGYGFMSISDSHFNINKLAELKPCGIIAQSPGWMLVENCKIVSEFGGGSLIGIYRNGTRGGTQLFRNNSFENLDWGIIQVPDSLEPVWPKDLEDELGLVLIENSFNDVPLEYGFLIPRGHGLAQTSNTFPRERARFNETLGWDLGGFSIFDEDQNIVLTKEGESNRNSGYPQQNFFINKVSNSGIADSQQTVPFEELMAEWMTPEFIDIDPSADLQTWIRASEIYRKQPQFLRDSDIRDQYFTDIPVWPGWALEEFFSIAKTSDKHDFALASVIVNQVDEEFNRIAVAGIPPYEKLRSYYTIDSIDIKFIETPDVFFMTTDVSVKNENDPVFSIYPNPTQDYLSLIPDIASSFTEELQLTYEIYSSSGRLIKSETIHSLDDLRIPVHEFSPGLYAICLRDVKSFYGAEKFIILHP